MACRIGFGQSAAEFNATSHLPWILKTHHMFWSIPVALIGLLFLRKPGIARALFGAAAGLVLSDLVHHFIVLPIWVGNTGWHWP